MQFGIGSDDPGAYLDMSTGHWEEYFGVPIPDAVLQRLSESGFQPSDENDPLEAHYWKRFEEFDAGSLSREAEWAFREIFGEEEDFTAEVDDFGQASSGSTLSGAVTLARNQAVTMAQEFAGQGRVEEVVAKLDEAIRLDPEDPFVALFTPNVGVRTLSWGSMSGQSRFRIE